MRILILEDELLIANDTAEILVQNGYKNIFLAKNISEAEKILTEQKIDFALLDVQLKNNESGIDVAKIINHSYLIPFVYVTSFSDKTTIDKLKETFPSGYVLKPFSQEMLLAVIEIAKHSFDVKKNSNKINLKENGNTIFQNNYNTVIVNNQLIVKENYTYKKVPLEEVLWLQSDKNYIIIKTQDRKYIIRCSLKQILTQLPTKSFVKCCKNYVINTRHVTNFTKDTVQILDQTIPVSRLEQSSVFKALMN